MKKTQTHKDLLPHLFRQEYGKMTAVLCRHFGLQNIEVYEDIVSETFLKASENWAINGIPDNPLAWLYTVAKNKTIDYFKHISVYERKIREAIDLNGTEVLNDFNLDKQNIKDSQLSMIFAVCNPAIPANSQVSLALQILCGFSVEEIANAFLTNTETIKKRLQRARTNLRNDNFQLRALSETEIRYRLDTVLKSLYLLFNEGYFSKSNNQVIRKELCSEAIRLVLVLTENHLTNTTHTNALLALMCFQSSRLEARINNNGQVVLFEDQDKNLWDKSLIEKGNYYLVKACDGNEISKYHLEAGLAYWHTTIKGENKWHHILHLYNQLIQMEYSPITALNRTFAFAKVYSHEKAIVEAEKLNLTELTYYHQLLGYLYSDTDVNKAIKHYKLAITLTKSQTEIAAITNEIMQLDAKATKKRG